MHDIYAGQGETEAICDIHLDNGVLQTQSC